MACVRSDGNSLAAATSRSFEAAAAPMAAEAKTPSLAEEYSLPPQVPVEKAAEDPTNRSVILSSSSLRASGFRRAEEGAMKAAEDATRCPEIPRRCHHCAGPLSKDMETSSWTVPPLVRDSFSMIGLALGGIAGAFCGFNHVMPVVRRHIKGPMWMHFFVGAPPVIVFSSAYAGLAGGTMPATAQLVSSSFHVVSLHSFARPSSHVATHAPSFAPSASHDDMHKTRSSAPL